MRIKRLYTSSQYRKSFKKLPKQTQEVVIVRINLFKRDPFSPQLKTHKLSGRLRGFWSFSVDYSNRIMFEFVDEGTVGLIDIGPHKIYRR
ncbi:type II toxin-antitoxin system YoeB family toxin [Patescibacteria group bacterium]|nr:type II toxin-antitoxin system YoeB family toxin [Patescibacteria group bacterium]